MAGEVGRSGARATPDSSWHSEGTWEGLPTSSLHLVGMMVPTALTPGMAWGFSRHSLEAGVAGERGAERSGVRPNGMRWPFLMCYFYSFYKSVEKSLFFIQLMNRLNSTISTDLPLFLSSFLLVSQGFPYGIMDAFLSSLLRAGRTS